MTDVVSALNRKRASLNAQKRRIREDAERMMAEIDAELENVARAIDTLNDAVREYLCLTCGGKGTIRKPDAAGQMEDCQCPACKGTGVQLQEDIWRGQNGK